MSKNDLSVRINRNSIWRIAFFLVFVTVALLFAGAPSGGAFYWGDAVRHALNGVMNLLREFPLDYPAGYVYQYYAQYPAPTILFCTPLLYAISAPFYLVFGLSHEIDLFTVSIHYLAFGLGCFAFARLWLSVITALAFFLLMALVSEIAFWGRQVMLQIPAFAFLVWSVVVLLIQYFMGLRVGRLCRIKKIEFAMGVLQFVEVVRVAITANHKAYEPELVVYRHLGNVGSKPETQNIEIWIINRTISNQ